MKQLISSFLKKLGYELRKASDGFNPLHYPDFGVEDVKIVKIVEPYTMTSPERIFSFINAVDYVVNNKIKGDIVECGVWRGGSSMAAALRLLQNSENQRHLYLYDTFEGMSEPNENDVQYDGNDAESLLNKANKNVDPIWCYSTIDEVKNNMAKTNYPASKISYVQGKVEDTIPKVLPNEIAILRLDTDWYESTKHEMEHLFPLLVPVGILIIDDYGHWQGARKAIDEYLKANSIKILLNRIDYTARIGVKR